MKDDLKGVGICGQRHYQYLKETRPTTVNVIRMNGTLSVSKDGTATIEIKNKEVLQS
ncbi:MAG: hypothetical protein IKS28_02795 [Clostridia bacterium]|nr:hypothetical protein [Clostridia bacterium]